MSQNFDQRGGKRPAKPIINKWEGEGFVKSRTANDNDEIQFFPFRNGGGAIHISVACSEMNGADENGQPRVTTSYIPVNVMTNRLITEQQLKGVRQGMKVHVVGKLQPESYTSKKTGNRVTSMVVNAYVFEILEMPQQIMGPGYAQPDYAPQPGFMPQQGYIQPGQYPAPQGGYQQPPMGGAPAPGFPSQPAYAQQQRPYQQPAQPAYQRQAPASMPAYQPQGAQAPAGAPPHGNIPPYYQRPGTPQGGGYVQPGQQQPAGPQGQFMPPAGEVDNDDMPPGDPINV